MPSVTPYRGARYRVRLLTSEAIAQGDFINIYNASGTPMVQQACTTGTKNAHGFVNAAYASGDVAIIELDGVNQYQSGLTPGTVWLSGTPGLATSTMPTSGLVQQVGVALSATAVVFSVGTTMADEGGGGSTTFSIVAGADIADGQFVAVYNASGTPEIRVADSSLGQGFQADGFVLAAYLTGATATVYGPGNVNTHCSGFTGSEPLWLAAAGLASASPDETAAHITQQIGFAISSTAMLFAPDPDVLRTTPGSAVVNLVNIASHTVLANPTGSTAPVIATPVTGDVVWSGGASIVVGITGGSNHQLLAKTSGSDYAYSWTSAVQGLTITDSNASLNYERETIITCGAGNGQNFLDWNLGGVARLTVTGSVCFFSHLHLPSGVGGTMLIELTNGGLGVVTTLFAGVLWPGGVTPTLTSSGFDLVSLYCSNGTDVHGAVVQLDSR